MTTILILTALPAALATVFDSVGFGLLTAAGLVWAAAIAVCSAAPLVAGRSHTVNETLASTLSTLAALVAIAGLVVVLLT